MLIFSKIESIINTLTAQLTTAAVSPQVDALKTIILIYITLWVFARGYMILAGKSDDPIKGLIFDATIKIIIVSVVFSPIWISLVTSAIDGMSAWASGGTSIYSRLDVLLKTALEVANKLSDMGPSILTFHVIGNFAGWVILIFFGVFSVITLLVIISATITLKILIMLSPIMIFTLMFNWFKQIFSKWLELVLNNTLTILIVGILLNALNGKYKDILDSANSQAGTGDILYICFLISVISVVLAWVVLMAKGIAQQLTFVSIEHLPGAAAKEGKELGGSAKNLGGKAIGGVSSASRGVGNVSARAIRRLRK